MIKQSRGEKSYINMPAFAARLYDNLTGVRGVNRSFEEIASFLQSVIETGRLLDVGTGPGRLLAEINRKLPRLELSGLDISEAMLLVAEKNLQHFENIDLRQGNITRTEYQDSFFDCIVTTGSFYNWDKPVDGINEIFRILKPGNTAFIFETYRDFNQDAFEAGLENNLREYTFLRRKISGFFLLRQLSMTYTLDEFDRIVRQSRFSGSYAIRQIELGNLPVYVRIELKKPIQRNET